MSNKNECNHRWISNSGTGGKAEFRENKQMASIPIMHIKCAECGCRTWVSKATWMAIKKHK